MSREAFLQAAGPVARALTIDNNRGGKDPKRRPGRDRHRGAARTPLPRQQARDLDDDQGRSQISQGAIAGSRTSRPSGRFGSRYCVGRPDWVCEITSPGHERKDLVQHFLLLQRNAVPYYWVIAPEDQVWIAYRLVDGKYCVVFSVERRIEAVRNRVRIPPLEEVEIDLAYVFGEAD
jgi:hypothetical protein